METADRRVPTGGDGGDPLAVDRRSRRAFTISLLVVVVVAVVALGYSFVRDPGPQPKYPPTISGTNDGAVKRVLVHYLGAVESGNANQVAELADLDVQDPALVQKAAETTVADFTGVAQKRATIVVSPGDGADELDAVIAFANGGKQTVILDRSTDNGRWSVMPASGHRTAAPPPVNGDDADEP